MRTIPMILILCAAPLVAQDEVQTKLAEARVLEEGEHDYAAAARIYRAVAAGESVDPAQRSEAWLRLGLMLQQNGDADGAKQALAAAAGGAGPAAEYARQRLATAPDGQDQSGSVELEILRLLATLRTGGDTTAAQQALAQLVWFGGRAVPLLTKAAGAESDYGFVTDCARALLEIGGPAVDAWLVRVATDPDALRRRAVVRAAGASTGRVDQARLGAFLDDPDAEVRLEAIDNGLLTTCSQATARLWDEDERVRTATWSLLGAERTELDFGSVDSTDARFTEVSELIAAASGGIPPDIDRVFVGWTFLRLVRQIGSPEQRALLTLRLVGTLQLPLGNELVDLGDVGGSPQVVASLMATARAVADRDSYLNAVDVVMFVHAACRASWDAARIPEELELGRLGFGFDAGWFIHNANPEAWNSFFAQLAPLGRGQAFDGGSLRRLIASSMDLELSPSAFEALRDRIEALLASAPTDPVRSLEPALRVAIRRAGRFDLEESPEWFYRLITEQLPRSTVEDKGDLLVLATEVALASGGPERVELARRLALCEGADLGPVRDTALGYSVAFGDEQFAPQFGTVYERGLSPDPHTGIGWLNFAYQMRGQASGSALPLELRGVPDPWPEWSTDACALAVQSVLNTGFDTAWKDVEQLVSVPGVAPVVIERFADCQDAWIREGVFQSLESRSTAWSIDRQRSLFLAALDDADANILVAALSRIHGPRRDIIDQEIADAIASKVALNEPRVASLALTVLGGTRDPRYAPLVRNALGSESSWLRHAGIGALAAICGPDATADLVPLLSDPEESVRLQVCYAAKQTLDRRYVTPLVEALRDESDEVRQAAREALEAIEFYVSQEQRWKRLLNDAGLEARNAAEALLDQAREATDPAIRLAAIRSLGTLGVPETLPFLIQWMQDPDAETAAAAAAAVDEINAKAR